MQMVALGFPSPMMSQATCFLNLIAFALCCASMAHGQLAHIFDYVKMVGCENG
jgi:hypothetical protein